jgi:hypothetical protein
VIARVTPSRAFLWPPNKRMVPVTVSVTATDIVDAQPVCRVTGVSSNEGTSADWLVTGPLSVTLRADRNGRGNGRIYTFAIACTDASGNVGSAMAAVVVPHDQGH